MQGQRSFNPCFYPKDLLTYSDFREHAFEILHASGKARRAY